ncbi:MAG: DnaB-like helicase C-terminal domain-containing protein [Bacteroidales bacterium]|nr:DnaB-like helicase C-terminal domain-containing protein [Bacteroidales bacterium]
MIYYFKGHVLETKTTRDTELMACPLCGPQRRPDHQHLKTLKVNKKSKYAYCYHCTEGGHLTTPGEELEKSEKRESKGVASHFRRPVFDTNKTKLSDELVKYFVEKRCIPQKVLIDLKVTEVERYLPDVKKKVKCIGFNYFVDGELVNTKYRDLEKHFAMEAGAEQVPYNIDSAKEPNYVYVVEGEPDAMSVIAAGFPSVISVPNGANTNLSWLDPFVESHFENKEIIYIAVDNDRKGMILCDELVRRFGRSVCRIVKFGEGCKDANDHLVKYGAESLRIYLKLPQMLPLEGVFSVCDVIDNYRLIYEKGVTTGLSTGFANLDNYLRFVLGKLCVVTGEPTAGKSEFVDMLVTNMYMNHDWRTAYFSPENMPIEEAYCKISEKMIGKKLEQGITTEEEYEESVRFLDENIFTIIPKEDFTIESILNKATDLIRRNGIKALVIDPYNCVEHRLGKFERETSYINQFLDKLTKYAEKHRILIILVAHPTKQDDDSKSKSKQLKMYDIYGSSHFYNKADFGLAVSRDENNDLTTIHILKVKTKNLGKKGKVQFIFNTVNGRYTPYETETMDHLGKFRSSLFDNSNWFKKKEGMIDATAKVQAIAFEEDEEREVPF